MTNNHCDFIPIEKAWELQERLGIKEKGEFARLCGVAHQTFNRWEKKGRMPQKQYSDLLLELHRLYKEDYDNKLRIIGL